MPPSGENPSLPFAIDMVVVQASDPCKRTDCTEVNEDLKEGDLVNRDVAGSYRASLALIMAAMLGTKAMEGAMEVDLGHGSAFDDLHDGLPYNFQKVNALNTMVALRKKDTVP